MMTAYGFGDGMSAAVTTSWKAFEDAETLRLEGAKKAFREIVRARRDYCLRPIPDAKAFEHGRNVPLDRTQVEAKLFGDVIVGHAGAQAIQYIDLTVR